MNYFVKAEDIRRWAERTEARSVLPHLLRRLVWGTADGITELDFPANESVLRSGFDGVVVCSTGNAWVPNGRSVWEVSVEKDVKGKADRAFQDRTRCTPREQREQNR